MSSGADPMSPSALSASTPFGMDSAAASLQAVVQPAAGQCFHCGDAVGPSPLQAMILGAPRAMCCLGCQLAAQSIVEAGLDSYYLDRTQLSRTAPLPEGLALLGAFDQPVLQEAFVFHEQGLACTELSLGGVRCAACGWLIEKKLLQLEGVAQVSVNLTSQRLQVRWNEARQPVSRLIEQVERLGYRARPFRQDTHGALLAQESRQMLMRLGVAGLGAMQAMMYAVAVYLGDYTGMDAQIRDFFHWVGLVVSLPVFLYAGQPFYRSAWSALRARSLNMDVPVSIALIITFVASSYATLTRSGEAYFDSVSMFIFFLLAGRFVELKARQRASQTAHDLMTIEPMVVDRLEADGQVTAVAAHQLQVGEQFRVAAGALIPCDSEVVAGAGPVSEALLTGESRPVPKQAGDSVLGGSQNYDQPLQLRVLRPVQGSQQAVLDRLMSRALAERSPVAQQADRMARWFVARVLVLAVAVFAVWWWVDPSRALWATLAVLVATCPCALSLATPITLTTGTRRLAELGVVVTRGHVIETWPQVSHVLMDKTGTLTSGEPVLIQQKNLMEGADWLQVATALEQGSSHPLARAFRRAAGKALLPEVDALEHVVGSGVTGRIEGVRYRLGHVAFGGQVSAAAAQDTLGTVLFRQQGEDWQAVAEFGFDDQLRPDAAATVQALQAQGVQVWMLSGDPGEAPQQIGTALGLDRVQGGLLPEDKVAAVKALQAQGHTVLMVGDGVNDAPVLATANLSVSMASGTDLAKISADVVLLGDRLEGLSVGRRVARKSHQIIQQNLRWAVVYNLAALVPAALGYVPPWLAAIGMSLSSLAVVLNALRLSKA